MRPQDRKTARLQDRDRREQEFPCALSLVNMQINKIKIRIVNLLFHKFTGDTLQLL
jgi:hypothetical protein